MYKEIIREIFSAKDIDLDNFIKVFFIYLDDKFKVNEYPIPFIDDISEEYEEIYNIIKKCMIGREEELKKLNDTNLLPDPDSATNSNSFNIMRISLFVNRVADQSIDNVDRWIIAFLDIIKYELGVVFNNIESQNEYVKKEILNYNMYQPIIMLDGALKRTIDSYPGKVNIDIICKAIKTLSEQTNNPNKLVNIFERSSLSKEEFNSYIKSKLFD